MTPFVDRLNGVTVADLDFELARTEKRERVFAALERIGGRLKPAPSPTEEIRSAVTRAAANGDEEAKRLIVSGALDEIA